MALGGGGLGRGLVHFLLFRLIFRGALLLWRVPGAGPVIDIALGVVLVALIILRAQLGPRWWQRRRGSSRRASRGRSRSDSESRFGPRDW